MDTQAAESRELAFWRDSPLESSRSFTLENITNKMAEARVWLRLLERYERTWQGAQKVLELGAGQGWASCIAKAKYPHAQMTVTDISDEALKSLAHWQRVLQVELQGARACRAYELPFADRSFDLVFAFAAAHHFRRHATVLAEIARVLTPNGKAVYFYEPVCPQWVHPLAHWRVNRKRPEVPEDVLRYPELAKLARKVGLQLETDFYPDPSGRGVVEGVYFTLLSRLPRLQRLLPSTANLVFTKLP